MEPPAAAPPPPLSLRILRTIVRASLAVIIALIVGLAACALSAPLLENVQAALGLADAAKANIRVLVLFTLGLVMLAGVLSWLGRRLSWRALGGVGLGVGAMLAWLAWDNATLRHTQTFADIMPSYPEAEASYAVLIRYGKKHPAGRDYRGSMLKWIAFDPEKPEPWIKHVTEHRAQIEAEWAGLAPVRAWWTELNAFEHVVDLMTPSLEGEIIAFSPVRELAQRTCAIATLQALDGRGDEAMATVLPLIEVSRKMQETGRSLVIQMVAIVVERLAMQTAGFVLDRAAVSPELRARLAAALTRPGGGEAGARRLVSGERILGQNSILGSEWMEDVAREVNSTPARWFLAAIDPFIYNRRATANLYCDFMTEAEDLIGRRQLPAYEARAQKFIEHDARPAFKNLGGRRLVAYAVPAYNKVSATYWKIQDQRAALLARVNAPPAATP